MARRKFMKEGKILAERVKKDAEEHRHHPAPREYPGERFALPGESIGTLATQGHAEALINARTDEQRFDLAMQLQKAYGNSYVQRLLSSSGAGSRETGVRRQATEEETAAGGAESTAENEEEEVMVIQARPGGDLQKQSKGAGGESSSGNKKEAMEAIGTTVKAFLATDLGKEWKLKVKKFAGTPAGMTLFGAGALGGLAGLYAARMNVPEGVVDFAGDVMSFKVGEANIKLQPIYKGVIGEKPKEWGGKVVLQFRW